MFDKAGPSLRFALGALAVWRVTHLLAAEDGPADVIARARAHLGNGQLGQLADCFACLSVWTAAPVAAAIGARRSDFVLNSLALSGAACLLERIGQAPEPPTYLLPDIEGEDHGLL